MIPERLITAVTAAVIHLPAGHPEGTADETTLNASL